MNSELRDYIVFGLIVLLVVVLGLLKVFIYPIIGWDIILLAIGVVVSIVVGGYNMFGLKKSNRLSDLANKTAKEANEIAELGVMPSIEFKYELRELKSDYKEKASYYNYIQKNLDKYGCKYHHLILFNGGNGQAINWVDAYNWEPFDGEPDGFNYEHLPHGQILIHTNYLFPGKENIQIPGIIAQKDVYEDAKWLLIRIKYSDLLGNKHCKCKQFIREEGSRGFVQDSQAGRSNIFRVNLPENERNRKKCSDCCFNEELIENGSSTR